MRRIRHLVSIFLTAALVAAGCGRKPAGSADVAVSIDGEEISYRQFEAYLHGQVDSADLELDGEVLSRLFDQFLDGQLLIRLAIERGLVERAPEAAPPEAGRPGDGPFEVRPPAEDLAPDRGPEAPAAPGSGPPEPAAEPPPGVRLPGVRPPGVGGVDERRAIAFLLRSGLEKTWTEEGVAAYYRTHQDAFRRPEEVSLRQILTHDRPRAEAAKQALDRGEDFVAVAARFSQGPKAHLGGDQGRLAREDLPANFVDAIFALEPGEVTDVVAADYGFLIFQVVARYPAETADLEEVAEEIHQALWRRHVDELVAGFTAEARARYNVKVFPDNFPFEYRGAYAS